MSDSDPIVLDPDDPAFAHPAVDAPNAGEVLNRVMHRSSAALSTSEAMQTYLRSVGLTDPSIWSAYRLGAGDASVGRGLNPSEQATLAGLGLVHPIRRQLVLSGPRGLNLPTFDPREPERVIGVVRITPAQNKHAFVTPAVGVGCAVDVTEAKRVVLVDGPFAGLRLAQAGVPHVILVEDPQTIRPLIGWLSTREVVIAAHRRERIDAMRAALGPIGDRAIIVVVTPDVALSPTASLSTLGITREDVRPPEPLPEITPKILHDLYTYACDRMNAGAANDALRTLEADDAEFVRAYRIGYLPPDYHDALSAGAQRALLGQRLGRSLVFPATDDDGQLVDLYPIYGGGENRARGGCFDHLRGMLGSHVLGMGDRIIVTDNFPWLARLHRQGYRNVLLLRGPMDAVLNAERVAAGGVRSVVVRSYRHGAEIAAAFSAAGISVTNESGMVTGDDWLSIPAAAEAASEPVAPPAAKPEQRPEPEAVLSVPPTQPPPRLAVQPEVSTRASFPAETHTVSVDHTPAIAERPAETAINATVTLIEVNTNEGVAICEVGPVRYAIEIGDSDLASRQVVARRGTATHQDRINLSLAVQCRRFATSAARRIEVDSDRIFGHLVEAWRLVRAYEAQAGQPAVVAVSAGERSEAELWLRDPTLLTHIAADLTALGWVGEDRAKGLLYLTAVSRLLPDPLWSVYRATAGAAPWRSLGMIASLMPPESCVVFHRLTESLLRRTDQRAFRNRLLLVDRAETLRPEGAIALRCLREWGSIGWKQVARAEGGNIGAPAGLVGDAIGPVAVLAAAAGDLDRRCRDCFLTVTVDESADQTARMLADQRRQHGPGAATNQRAEDIIRRHHALQRLLRPADVVIPFADRIAFPTTRIRHRDEHAAFLNLISASALLHQFQRGRDSMSALIATEVDFHHAVAVAGHLLGAQGDGLSEQSRQLQKQLFAAKVIEFGLSDLGGLVADWTYYTYRACAEELVQMGFCTAVGGGQGRARRYTLTGRSGGESGIALLPVGSGMDTTQPRDLANVSKGTSQGPNIFTRVS